jgi:hypothetical protein
MKEICKSLKAPEQRPDIHLQRHSECAALSRAGHFLWEIGNMQNLRKFKGGKFTKPQKQHGRGRGVHTSVTREFRSTDRLPIGTAKRFVDFSTVAARNGVPLNTLLTLRWHALRVEGASYAYLSLPPRERISKSVELLRKFTTSHGSKFPWIWVQECPAKQHGGLHWHIAFHSQSEWHDDLMDYVEKHFGLARLPTFLVREPTQGELARSEAQAWHLAIDTRPDRQGLHLALYLGKGDSGVVDIAAASGFGARFNWQGNVTGTNKDRFAISRPKFE